MRRMFILLVVTCLGSAPAFAKGDVAYGEYLSTACVTCHQLTGIDNGIPSIVGWEEKAFVKALIAYRKKERENPVMRMITEPMTDEEMESLAAYFSTIKPIEEPED